MFAFSFRQIYSLGFLACAALLGAAYYFEYYMYLDPCPLCIMQRIAVFALALVFLVGAIHGPSRVLIQQVYTGFGILAAVFGAAIAGRHVWIQSLPPDQVPTCGPSLDYMVDTLPLAEVISVMLRGNGNCAEAVWSFMGLSMPQWTLVWFVGFTLVGVGFCWMLGRQKNT